MNLTDTDLVLLSEVAQALVNGKSADINLYPLQHVFQSLQIRKEMLNELKTRVEQLSGNRRTIQVLDKALVSGHPKAQCAYIVVCDQSEHHPSFGEPVVQRTDDMLAAVLSPYSNGFNFPEQWARTTEVNAYRTIVAQGSRRSEYRKSGGKTAAAFMDQLFAHIKRRINSHPNSTERADAASFIQYPTDLQQVAASCAVLGIKFEELIADVALENL